MRKFFRPFLALALIASSSCALAQTTVGEVLDAGGTKISKEKLTERISGTKVTGLSASGKLQLNIDMKADGTLTGYVTSTEGHGTSGTFGKWAVDENGKYCFDEQLSAWRLTHRECWFVYKLGEDIFVAADSDDRNTKVTKRSTGKKPE